jgi:hypothetical protein
VCHVQRQPDRLIGVQYQLNFPSGNIRSLSWDAIEGGWLIVFVVGVTIIRQYAALQYGDTRADLQHCQRHTNTQVPGAYLSATHLYAMTVQLRSPDVHSWCCYLEVTMPLTWSLTAITSTKALPRPLCLSCVLVKYAPPCTRAQTIHDQLFIPQTLIISDVKSVDRIYFVFCSIDLLVCTNVT